MSSPLLAAVLVVRDEAEQLPACLASLSGVVDDLVVHDTGSVDGTADLAAAAGARVHHGYWDDDFSRARNLGLDQATADWVLVVDADERVRADVPALRALLTATTADVVAVAVHNLYPDELGGSYSHPGPRLLRREAVRYQGRVHEQPLPRVPRDGAWATCPAEVLTVDHLGYAEAAVVRAKAARNADLAELELRRLRARRDVGPTELAKVLLDLGRSLVVGRRLQEAVDAFEEVRSLVPGSRRAIEATDALARVLLGAGMDEVVLLLAEQLRASGVDGQYCDWLRAQALAQLGQAAEAVRLLGGVDHLRDSAGRELDLGQVWEMRALVTSLIGDRAEAADCLVIALARYGRIAGRGGLLLDLWGPRGPEDLARKLLAALPSIPGQAAERAAGLATELSGCRAPGAHLAALVRAGTPASVRVTV